MCLSAVLYKADGNKEESIVIPCHLCGSSWSNQFHTELIDSIDGQQTPIIAERLEEMLDWLYRGHCVKRTKKELEAQRNLFDSLTALHDLCIENSGIIEIE